MPEPVQLSLSDLTQQNFEGYLNQTFSCDYPLALTFTLSEVTSHFKQEDLRVIRAPFSLVFEAESEHRLEQGMYQLFHDEMGTIEMFLVPIAQHQNRFSLEASFN